MPNYKGVEVPNILLTHEDVAVHASVQDPANAIVYASEDVPAPAPAEEPVVEDHTDGSSAESESESGESTDTAPKKRRSRRGH